MLYHHLDLLCMKWFHLVSLSCLCLLYNFANWKVTWAPIAWHIHFVARNFIQNLISERKWKLISFGWIIWGFEVDVSLLWNHNNRWHTLQILHMINETRLQQCFELLYKIFPLHNSQSSKLLGNWYTFLQLDVMFDDIFSSCLWIVINE